MSLFGKKESTTCPRRMEEAGPWDHQENIDFWRADQTCSFCGSLHPTVFMEGAGSGMFLLGPTDKRYKVYLNWGDHDEGTRKFYFQHLSEEQRTKFVEYLNKGILRMGPPGHFYVKPFFVSVEEKQT